MWQLLYLCVCGLMSLLFSSLEGQGEETKNAFTEACKSGKLPGSPEARAIRNGVRAGPTYL